MGEQILIGGAPCAGKSTLAAALAQQRGWAIVAVDDLRSQFQQDMVAHKEHYPWLYLPHNVSAEEFWKSRGPADLIQMEIEQAKEYWPSLRARITSQPGCIFEGVPIMPELLWQEFGTDIKALFLIDPNRARVEETIRTRGLWGPPETYADWIKPRELEWVMSHNDWCRQQAKKYPYPLLEVGDRADVVAEAIKLLEAHYG